MTVYQKSYEFRLTLHPFPFITKNRIYRFANVDVFLQKLCIYEMEENTITVIDTEIIFKLIMHHVGKLFKLNLLIFSMSRVEFISYFRRSV